MNASYCRSNERATCFGTGVLAAHALRREHLPLGPEPVLLFERQHEAFIL